MTDIYRLISDYEVKRKSAREKEAKKGDEFKPYMYQCRALKLVGWRLRDVIDMLYSSVLSHIKEEDRIDNNQLSRKIYIWKKKGLFDEAIVNLEFKRLNAVIKGEEVEPMKTARMEVNELISGSHSVLSFLKLYEKRLGIECDSQEKLKLAEFYKANKQEEDINKLVEMYLKSKGSNLEINS
ncbi:hypothetical protein [Achromobacter xylosoxidans]|uniref:hypothetical protein n=1 Tax=Alcaligenes xylosoxydans xylosoxydans TaxID=85698 RepID=UPI000AC5FC85|nr:hypothetical protein [Achromobacter xylosoxidans]